MVLLSIGIAAFLATLLGGLGALRFRDRLHLILGFSAGAVIGVSFFDLLPEAISLGGGTYAISIITSLVAGGFVLYLILDRFLVLHPSPDENIHQHQRGILGAGSLSIHSFLDGTAIGLAFQVSVAVGVIVAVAVLVHDFSDGINTISMIIKNGGEKGTAMKWLLVDAVAPVAGVMSTFLYTLPIATLGMVLAVFTGFFIYIGASDLLPESHHAHPTGWTTCMTILGITVLYVAIRLANV
jgi:ZIP family zinc transporter